MSLVLRDYQDRLLNDARQLIRRGTKRILLQLPTGGGKTVIAATMLGNSSKRGLRSWFVCHRRELVAQASRTFSMVGIPHGIIAAGFSGDYRQPVQVCSIQTLTHRLALHLPPGIIVWDECHHTAAKSWATVQAAYPDALHLGLSATPARLDGAGLSDHFDAMVFGPSVRELIERGALSHYRLFAPSPPDLSDVATRMGEFVKSDVARVMDKPTITGDAVGQYQKATPGQRGLIFAASVEHSQHVVAAFVAVGIAAEHVDGNTPADLRDAAIRRFNEGTTRLLSNVGLFGEGFDVPAAAVLIDLAPTQSLTAVMQRWGRVLRPEDGKVATINDHAGNSLRHGLPDDPREWSLRGRDTSKKKGDTGVPVKQCVPYKNAAGKMVGGCYGVSPAAATACKVCGVPFEVNGRDIEQVDGELVEVDITAEPAPQQDLPLPPRFTCKDDYVAEAYRRGYKRPLLWGHAAWVQHQQQERSKRG